MAFSANLAGRFSSGVICTERPCRQRTAAIVGRFEPTVFREAVSSSLQHPQPELCSTSTSALERGYDGLESVLELVYQNYSPCVGLVEEKDQKQKKDRKDEFHIRFGRAIRQLRQDIPETLQRQGNLDIFREDLELVDNISPSFGFPPRVSASSRAEYARVNWWVRMVAAVLFHKSQLVVLRIWPKDEQCVAVRWTVRGVVRFLGEVGGTTVTLDGVSEYRFDSEGRIYQHILDRVNWDGHVLAKHRHKLEQALPVSTFCMEK